MHIELRDGARILVRAIRPDDKAALVRGFELLSRDSVYQRFLSPINELRPMDLVYLTEVDHHDHEAYWPRITRCAACWRSLAGSASGAACPA